MMKVCMCMLVLLWSSVQFRWLCWWVRFHFLVYRLEIMLGLLNIKEKRYVYQLFQARSSILPLSLPWLSVDTLSFVSFFLPRTSLSLPLLLCAFFRCIHVFSTLYSSFMTRPQLFAGCQPHIILFKSSAKVTWDQVYTVPCAGKTKPGWSLGLYYVL